MQSKFVPFQISASIDIFIKYILINKSVRGRCLYFEPNICLMLAREVKFSLLQRNCNPRLQPLICLSQSLLF